MLQVTQWACGYDMEHQRESDLHFLSDLGPGSQEHLGHLNAALVSRLAERCVTILDDMATKVGARPATGGWSVGQG